MFSKDVAENQWFYKIFFPPLESKMVATAAAAATAPFS